VLGARLLAATIVLLPNVGAADDPTGRAGAEEQSQGAPRLRMSKAVACESIAGYGQFVALEEPAVTRDDKLRIYFEPINHGFEKVGDEYQARLVEDVIVRRKGEKAVVWKKDGVVKYEPKSKTPPVALFIENTLAVKTYAPGEYELEIILHDKIRKGPPASQIFQFQVKSSPESPPAESEKSDKKPDGKTGDRAKKTAR
jgi:hypothetical protein